MVRYFLTDLRGNPIYSFAQRRLRIRQNAHITRNHQRLSLQLNLQGASRSSSSSSLAALATSNNGASNGSSTSSTPTTTVENHSDFVTTTLVCMVRNRAWDDALKRTVSHPHEVHVTDAVTGNTVLHVACRLNPPASIVQALATAATARHPNAEGATPLHIAASHRCSGPAVQALLDACGRFTLQQKKDNGTSTTGTTNKADAKLHTSPTADLSRMGRAPIHYACMSFRGLEIDAFRLLLDATLQEGNVWVWDRQPQDDEMAYGDEMDDYDLLYSSINGNNNAVDNGADGGTTPGGSKQESIVETPHEDEAFDILDYLHEDDQDDLDAEHHLFDNEHDKDLYVQQSDDLTVDDCSKTNGYMAEPPPLPPPIKVLVNVMGIKDATGQTPLGLLFRRYRERVRIVINTVDKLRRDQQEQHNEGSTATAGTANTDAALQNPELVAALRVHADLGELWEKARWIVARLTEERLHREQHDLRVKESGHDSGDSDNANKNDGLLDGRDDQEPPRHPPDATSRRATYFGSTPSSFYDAKFAEPPSPAEAAVAQEAASWAVEQHSHHQAQKDDLLPLAPNVSTADHYHDSGDHPSSTSSTGRQFRIVHASVGLTGYGCPPELIRLAISIHPQQVLEMDEDGNLPLHIAVTAASYLATAHMAASRDDSFPTSIIAAAASTAGNNSDDHSVMSDAALSFFSSATVSQTTNPFDKVIKILLEHYPEAAQTPQGKSGRLPLVLAVESGRRTWADGIRTLLNAYPPALHNKKVIDPAHYPNVLSLVAQNSGMSSLSSPFLAFDFAGCRDMIESRHHGHNNGNDDDAATVSASHNNMSPSPMVGASATAHTATGAGVAGRHRSKRAIRQETCSRSTLFELLRTKPEWLTRGFDDNVAASCSN